MATNYKDKIRKIGAYTFIFRTAILKRIRTSERQWAA